MSDTQVRCDGSKYTFVVRDQTGAVECLRNGEPWVQFDQGSKALISLIHMARDNTDALLKIADAKLRHTDEPYRIATQAVAMHGRG